MATLTGHVSHYTEEMAAERAARRVSKACMRSPKGSKFGASVRLPMRRLPDVRPTFSSGTQWSRKTPFK